MSLTLTLKSDTKLPVEVEGLTPTWAKDKALSEICGFEIYHGNKKIPLAEVFDVEGEPRDLRFDFQGDLSSVHWIGAHMQEGEIHIHGPAGRHLGSAMMGGQIVVDGDAAGWVGAEMRGGKIRVRGNAGDLVGAAYRGSTRGMTGGTILVEGDVGSEVGLLMRRGLIAVSGNAGDLLGFNMIAGTALVFGSCGKHIGAGMRRGTLALLGPNPPALLPTFLHACQASPTVLPLMLKSIRADGFDIDERLLTAECDLYHGDMVTLGRGEILVRC
ncbi:MAG: formylmethanofuran dehydrogenase subunit C [Planctomycetota bacterium]